MKILKVLLGADFHGDFTRLFELADKASLCICCGDIFGYHEVPPEDFAFPLPFYSIRGNKELQRNELLTRVLKHSDNFFWLNEHLDELQDLTGLLFYGIDHDQGQVSVPEDIEVIISHQPAYGIADSCRDLFRGNFIAHCGSKQIREIIERYEPEFLISGHVHIHQEQQHGKTRVITLSPALNRPVFIEKRNNRIIVSGIIPSP